MNVEKRNLAYNIRSALISDYHNLEGYYVSITDNGVRLESTDGTKKVYYLSFTKARSRLKNSKRDR